MSKTKYVFCNVLHQLIDFSVCWRHFIQLWQQDAVLRQCRIFLSPTPRCLSNCPDRKLVNRIVLTNPVFDGQCIYCARQVQYKLHTAKGTGFWGSCILAFSMAVSSWDNLSWKNKSKTKFTPQIFGWLRTGFSVHELWQSPIYTG